MQHSKFSVFSAVVVVIFAVVIIVFFYEDIFIRIASSTISSPEPFQYIYRIYLILTLVRAHTICLIGPVSISGVFVIIFSSFVQSVSFGFISLLLKQSKKNMFPNRHENWKRNRRLTEYTENHLIYTNKFRFISSPLFLSVRFTFL